MLRHLSLIGAFVTQFLKARMAYRLDFFVSFISTFISTALGFVFLFVIFRQIPDLDTWSFNEVLFIYGFSLVPIGMFSVMSSNLWIFGDKFVIEGNFDRVLVRPLHSLYQVLCESFRVEAIPDIFLGIYIVLYSGSKLGVEFSVLNIFCFIVLAISGMILMVGFFGMVASINFWVEDRVGIEAPLFNMISLARYPLPVYNQFLKILLSTAIPFAYVAFYPSTFFLNRAQFRTFVILTPVMAVVACGLCAWVWERGVRAYGSTGN